MNAAKIGEYLAGGVYRESPCLEATDPVYRNPT